MLVQEAFAAIQASAVPSMDIVDDIRTSSSTAGRHKLLHYLSGSFFVGWRSGKPPHSAAGGYFRVITWSLALLEELRSKVSTRSTKEKRTISRNLSQGSDPIKARRHKGLALYRGIGRRGRGFGL